MLKKTPTFSSKPIPQTSNPHFLDDQYQSHQSQSQQCYACSQYQQDIHLLQQKLMETHNKLIEQIDVCREQEIRIIELMGQVREADQDGKDKDRELERLRRDRDRDRMPENNQYTGNRQQQGKLIKKSQQQNPHSLQPLIEARTELLRNDLQAMRSKVLSQIVKSNRLKQQNNELQIKHQVELQEFKDRIRKLEACRNKLVDENQRLYKEIEEMRDGQGRREGSGGKCCGYQHKFYELDKAFMSQRLVTNQLIEQNSKLQNKIQQLYQQKLKSQYPKQASPPLASIPSQKRSQQIRTEPKRKQKYQIPTHVQHTHNQGQHRQKHRQQFEATKNLIKQLEEAQLELRRRKN